MKALQIYAGATARARLAQQGLQPADIAVVAGAAGGPKGLVLGPLDRFIFGDWLPQSTQPVDLVGASIGAWRMATACLGEPIAAFERLEHDYIHQHYATEPGRKGPSADQVSAQFAQSLHSFFGGRVAELLLHPRYRLHIFTSHGRGLLAREGALRTPLGYLGAFVSNAAHRKAMGAWLERVVFSSSQPPPFATQDYRTQQVLLQEANFMQALQASCSIPFVLRAVHDIPGAAKGAYWDGGITDYHLHLDYPSVLNTASASLAEGAAASADSAAAPARLVLYPHFQRTVIPGWLDKSLAWRHKPTAFLSNTVLLAPRPEWVKSLPNGKLPDRNDFAHYGDDLAGRVKAWRVAASAAAQMVDEWAAWLAAECPVQQVEAL